MENSSKNCLIGCGIGCGLLVALAIAVIAMGGWMVRDFTRDLGQAVDVRTDLEERFGSAEDYTPPASGAIPSARLELFIAVREAFSAERTALAETTGLIDLSKEDAERMESESFVKKLQWGWKTVRGATGLVGDIGEFHSARNQALLAHEMGIGEYTYLFLTVYEAAGGPPTDEELTPGLGSTLGESSSARVSREWRGMLQRQAALVSSALAESETDPWPQQLLAEWAVLEADPKRRPWSDGLPERIADSIAPFRDRLDALYDRRIHKVELTRTKKRGGTSFTVD